ncbi:MAG: diguanylate cyclase [Sulfurimonas sp.]|nr:diguanylate cyclase [Sulfurimonas sp.]
MRGLRMFEGLSVKNKTMLFVSSVLLFFAFILSLFIYLQQQERVESLQSSYHRHFLESYDKIILKHKEFYENRVRANIASAGVKEALEKQDREKLYALSKGRWETLRKENIFLDVMHFHLCDGTSFLRMHKEEKHSDMIASFRPMLAQVHEKKEPLSGFEAGVYSFSYRVALPIFKDGKYLGALEFGSKPEHILSEMEFFYDLKGAIFIKKSPISATKETKYFEIGNYALVYENLENQALLDGIGKNYNFEDNKNITLDDRNYILYSIDLLDFQKNSVGKVVFFNDITDIQREFYQALERIFFFLTLLLVVILFVVHFGFEKIITILEMANKKVEANYKKMHNYLELIDKNIITSNTDLEGNITYASEALCRISGYEKEELFGQKHNILRHKDMPSSFYENLWASLEQKRFFRGDIKNRTKDGESYWIESTIYALYDEKGVHIGYTSVARDISDRKKVEEISITDALTKLYNRGYFDRVCQRVLDEAKRADGWIAFMIMDIDFFKEYNDTYGHQEGDKVLREVAHSIAESLKRPSDYAFRLGGEEFGVLLKPEEAIGTLKLAHKIQKGVGALKIKHAKSSVAPFVTVSLGIVTKRAREISSCDALYKEADDLLYHAKANGRNSVSANI